MVNLKIEKTRYFSAHNRLLSISSNFLTNTELELEHSTDGEWVSLILSALAIESFCNAVLETTEKDWNDYETANPRAKIRIICEKYGIKYDKNREPFQNLNWVISFRNKIAHAKPERITIAHSGTYEDYERMREEGLPLSKIELQVSIEKASSVLKSVQEFKRLVLSRIPDELSLDLEAESWNMHAEPDIQS